MIATIKTDLKEWVEKMEKHFQPDSVHWCDGSQGEYDLLCQQLVEKGTFIKLNQEKRPGSFACFSDPSDVARVEDRTFICSRLKEDAGPTNNWMEPTEMKKVLDMGLHMCIYPEGTRNKTSEPLKPFHDGAFRLSLDTRKSIIPGVIFYTRIVNPAHKSFYLMPHKLRIDFLEPITVGENDTVETLKGRAFEAMREHFLKVNGER